MGNFILTKEELLVTLDKLEDECLREEIKKHVQKFEILESENFYIPNNDEELHYLKNKLNEYAEIYKENRIIVSKLEILSKKTICNIEIQKIKSYIFMFFSSMIEKINTFESRIQIIEGIKDIENLKAEMKDHDRNMLNIMGILLAIFSLVGINMGMFGAIKAETSVNEIITLVLVVNISLVFSMGALFTYIDHIFTRYEKKK